MAIKNIRLQDSSIDYWHDKLVLEQELHESPCEELRKGSFVRSVQAA